MSSSLSQLVRVSRWKVDEKSRDLARLLADAETLRLLEEALEAEFAREKLSAETSVEGAMTFGAYTETVYKRRTIIAKERARIEQRVEEAREALRLVMGEAKKFEIAAANQATREKATLRARENEALDEAALNGFRRKGLENEQG